MFIKKDLYFEIICSVLPQCFASFKISWKLQWCIIHFIGLPVKQPVFAKKFVKVEVEDRFAYLSDEDNSDDNKDDEDWSPSKELEKPKQQTYNGILFILSFNAVTPLGFCIDSKANNIS